MAIPPSLPRPPFLTQMLAGNEPPTDVVVVRLLRLHRFNFSNPLTHHLRSPQDVIAAALARAAGLMHVAGGAAGGKISL